MGNEFIVEGKKYISASRASKICGYNPDYIGQLCRKNHLDCRRVGRVWFVEEESLKNHKIIASQTPRGRIPFSKKNFESFKAGANSVDVQIANPVTNLENSPLIFRSDLQFETDFVNKSLDKKHNKPFFQKVAVGIVAILLIVIFAPVLLSGKSSSSKLTFLTGQENFISETISSFFVPVLGSIKNYTNDTAGSVAYSANIFYSVGDSWGKNINSAIVGVRGAIANLGDVFKNTTNKIKLAFSDSQTGVDGSFKKERTGVAVLPSANNDAINAQVKEYVVNSFSDETKIVPDESGNSGLIKPVFRDESDQEYLYVIVPVKEGQN